MNPFTKMLKKASRAFARGKLQMEKSPHVESIFPAVRTFYQAQLNMQFRDIKLPCRVCV